MILRKILYDDERVYVFNSIKLMYSTKFSKVVEINIRVSFNKNAFLVLHTIYMSTRLCPRQINFLFFWCSIFQSSQKMFGV